ncbi:penicillin-binding transpeptidase domain-containing protein [Georgenia yuyongxinii]|uniref:Beta-lactamase n=1 Tax=Georgenia yuyongxinii TaxID=2589797 RepID=A0A552WU99_9MICO|nr:penicillin-binding transpeptidase domain-containing protein [Georgenia yuyongxinii]TRW46286.1 penicillin-binding protein [Georgenia yuyongxinii]
MPARIRPHVVAALALVAAGGLSACTGTPDPQTAATALAEALATGTLDGAPLSAADSERATTELDEVLGTLAETPRTVVADVGEVEEAGDAPTVPVELTWTVDVDASDTDLTWTSSTELTLDGDSWTAPWARRMLHPDAGTDGVLSSRRVPADRGEILGAGGSAIVTSREVWRIGIDKANLPEADVADAAVALATTLGLDPQAFADRTAAAGPRAFVEAIVVRRYDHGDVDVEGARRLPGVLLVEDVLPLAPTAAFARPVLGTVGAATAELIENSDGAIQAGDVVGLSGLQQQYDETLRGLPGTTVALTAGGATREIFSTEPRAGSDVTTTLDPRLQMVAESLLSPVKSPSALVALRPSTGEVLAAASGPGSAGFSTATLGGYAPGSTFKVATALALLRSGLTTDSPMDCTPTAVADGREFSNYPGFPADAVGPTTLEGVIATSCNTALIGARDRVDAADLATAAASLGLGVALEAGVPTLVGEVPTDATGTEHAASMIGQGRIVASPLAMATVAASVAAGSRVSPVLVTDVGGKSLPAAADGAVEAATDETSAPAPLTDDEAAALRRMMRAVVTDGTASFLVDVPGGEVFAKTGTAEFGAQEAAGAHAWIVGFQDDLAVAVLVEDGFSGAATAGPLLEELLRAAR